MPLLAFVSLVAGTLFPGFGCGSDGLGWLFVAMAFAAGAIVGSFVNVVAHRVPLGQSVVTGRSACPTCGRQIRARDNLPVLGWLLLRGRCRDCNVAISPRYVLVEAGCGLLLAALAASQLVDCHTLDMAPRSTEGHGLSGDVRMLTSWGAKAVTLLTLLAWGLLARAGHAIAPSTAALATVVVGGLAAAGCVRLSDGVGRAAVGAAAGWAIAAVLGMAADRRFLPVVGAAGGWQAAVATAGIEAGIRVLRMAVTRRIAHGSPRETAFDALAAVGSVWIVAPLAWTAASQLPNLLR